MEFFNGAPTAVWAAIEILWIFALGASLGSFLNVVVHRLPLGMNLATPGSRCPQCLTPIKAQDNIPVLSWLLLRGKCRVCGKPISPRYAIVEALMGAIFVMLFWLEMVPSRIEQVEHLQHEGRELLWIDHLTNFEFLSKFMYHAAVAWFVVGILLFRSDGHRVPRWYWIIALGVALLSPTIWPALLQL